MSPNRKLRRLFRLAGWRATPEADARAEVDLHLELRAEELRAAGYSEPAARREAERRFGSPAGIALRVASIDRAGLRSARRREWWADLWQDLHYAGRALRRNPGFAGIAIATIGLGIGATTSILGVVDGVLVRRLPYPTADRLSLVWSTPVQSPGVQWPISAGSFLELGRDSRTLERLSAFRSWSYALPEESGAAGQIDGARVTGAFFQALGVRPALGRLLSPDDDRTGAAPVVVLSHALWRARFGSDPNVVGREIRLNREPYTVVGVAEPGFHFPRGAELPSGLAFPLRSMLWTPMAFTPAETQNFGTQNLAVIGHRKPGIEGRAVAADLVAWRQLLIARAPQLRALDFFAVPLSVQAEGGTRPTLLLLLGAVACLLLIACANGSNLLLTRAAMRNQEIAMRIALGASRGRLVRQFLTENVALMAGGGALGVAIAWASQRALLSFVPASLPRIDDIGLDWRVLGFVVVLVMALGLGFGLVTALEITRQSRQRAGLAAGGRTVGQRSGQRAREVIIVLEVAASLVLLVGAGVLARSFWKLQSIDPGLETEHVLTAQLLIPTADFDAPAERARWLRFFTQLEDRLAGSPGVVAAAGVTSLPLSGAWQSTDFGIEGRGEGRPGEDPNAQFAVVGDAYFKALGVPLVAGRFFGTRDRVDSATTVIVSRSLARQYFPGVDPIGRRIRVFGPRWYTIVGVVGDVRQTGLDLPPVPALYLAEAQSPFNFGSLVIRTQGEPAAIAPVLRQAVRALDGSVAVSEVTPMDRVLAQSLAQRRFTMTLLMGFALAAVVLAVIGLYGVIAHAVAGRTREFGVRAALGADPRAMLGLVVREGLVLAGLGVLIGAGAAALLSRLLRSLVFEVSPLDPLTIGATATLLLVVAGGAASVPARRAMRVSPVVALRNG